jgi:hypothetical protein
MLSPLKLLFVIAANANEDWQRCQEKNDSATMARPSAKKISGHRDLAHKCLFSGC